MEIPTAATQKAEPLPFHNTDNTDTRKNRTTAKTNLQGEKHYNKCSHYSPSPPYLRGLICRASGWGLWGRGVVAVEPVD